jgi:hypothetical protein
MKAKSILVEETVARSEHRGTHSWHSPLQGAPFTRLSPKVPSTHLDNLCAMQTASDLPLLGTLLARHRRVVRSLTGSYCSSVPGESDGAANGLVETGMDMPHTAPVTCKPRPGLALSLQRLKEHDLLYQVTMSGAQLTPQPASSVHQHPELPCGHPHR